MLIESMNLEPMLTKVVIKCLPQVKEIRNIISY